MTAVLLWGLLFARWAGYFIYGKKQRWSFRWFAALRDGVPVFVTNVMLLVGSELVSSQFPLLRL